MGRVVSATVYTRDGTAHAVAGFEIESGPAWRPNDIRHPGGYPQPHEDGGLPLLATGSPRRLVPAADAPIGRRVRLHGLAFYQNIAVRVGGDRDEPASLRRPVGRDNPSNVILVSDIDLKPGD